MFSPPPLAGINLMATSHARPSLKLSALDAGRDFFQEFLGFVIFRHYKLHNQNSSTSFVIIIDLDRSNISLSRLTNGTLNSFATWMTIASIPLTPIS